jgi:DNA-binding response OmpR family regulator
MNIYIIEDNEKMVKNIAEYLDAFEYKVFWVKNYEDILGEIENIKPKLILLDINLPKSDGFYFLKLIRKHYQIPVIILSARCDEGEQIRGMELGADDYITKPFKIGVLTAKISALLRRVHDYKRHCTSEGDLTLIHDSMKLKCRGQILELSKNEYILMYLFLSNVGVVISREKMFEELWDDEKFVDDNTLTVNITRIKKKLETIGIENSIITIRGVGYVFVGTNNQNCES